MTSLDPIAIAPQSQLVVALRASPDGAISITRLEALTDQISMIFSERGETPVWQMLSEEFRRFVSHIVASYRDRPGLVFLDNLRLQIGALTLLGCKVLSTRTSGGRSNLILRFPYVVGDITELLAVPSVRPRSRGPVLQKLLDLTSAFFMPLRDISLHLDSAAERDRAAEGRSDGDSDTDTHGGGGGRPARALFERVFREKLREAEFAFFLLRRHIEDLEQPARDPGPGRSPDCTHPPERLRSGGH